MNQWRRFWLSTAAVRVTRSWCDRGSASIEMAVLAPAVIALFATLMIAGRTVTARQAIEAAAFDAARTASLARDGDTARARALTVATATLTAQGLNCVTLRVDLNTDGFAVPVGQPANVIATVVCVADFSDLALPGMPGSAVYRATFVSPLDQFRGRSPT